MSAEELMHEINDQEEAETPKEKSLFAQLYEESLSDVVREGQIVKGRIVKIGAKEIVVDIGYKSEGVVSISEFQNPETIKLGDEVNVLLETREDENGMVILSKEKAERAVGWEMVIARYVEGDVLDGRVTRKVKGGFMVDIGVEAFLPASLASLKSVGGPNQMIAQVLPFKIVKINKARRNIVVSHKDALQQQREEDKKKLLETLTKGALLPGVVRNITDFGAFVDIGGGVIGLLHITDMSWGRISHPSEVLAIGDKIDVLVLDFDKDTMRISLGLKQNTPNPWDAVEEKYHIGDKLTGAVVNIVPYGAFVELEKGIEGLVHISEMSWTKRYNHPNEILAMGDKIEAVVLSIDKSSQKIALGLKQLESNPWLEVESRYPVGTRVKGKVRNMTDYGAFVELEDGIDGLLHISDISWTKRIGHPKDVFKKGEKIEAVVLAVDGANHRISLGVKQLVQDPWDAIAERIAVGTVIDGKVTKISNFGLFIEIEPDLEGLAHVSELSLAPQEKLEERFQVGSDLKVKVLKVDSVQRKIALSTKDL